MGNATSPVNEPLTTARFCALYGHWYPHARSDATFVRAIIHQCRATVLAMRAIREVHSSALVSCRQMMLGRLSAHARWPIRPALRIIAAGSYGICCPAAWIGRIPCGVISVRRAPASARLGLVP